MAAEGARLVVGQLDHGDAAQVGALGLLAEGGVGQQEHDDAGAVLGLGDALLPPGEELLVGQGWEKRADHVVEGDARSVQGGDVGHQVAVLGLVKDEGHGDHGGRAGGAVVAEGIKFGRMKIPGYERWRYLLLCGDVSPLLLGVWGWWPSGSSEWKRGKG